MKGYRLGVDVGGTFTDLILIDSKGRPFYTEFHSTPQDQTIGVLGGIKIIIEQYGAQPEMIDQIVHGTTNVTNAKLERKGSKTALLTIHGFKDFLYIGRETRSELHSFSPQKPDPLISGNLNMEVP